MKKPEPVGSGSEAFVERENIITIPQQHLEDKEFFSGESIDDKDIFSLSTETTEKNTLPLKKGKAGFAPRPSDPGDVDAKMDNYAPSILAYSAPESSKIEQLTGEAEMKNSFIKYYHSLHNHPAWRSASPKYRVIFLEWLVRVAWKKTTYSYYGKIYPIEPGQVYFSARNLADFLSKDMVDESGKISRHDVRGAIRFFTRCNFCAQPLAQPLAQPMTVLNIVFSTFCDNSKETSRPASRPASRPHLAQPSPTKLDILDILDKKKKKRGSRVLVATEDGLRRAKVLFQAIRKIKANYPEPKFDRWASEIDKITRIDEVDGSRIDAVLEWLPKSGFWSTVILSADSLRKNFQKLEMNIQAEKDKTLKKQPIKTDLQALLSKVYGHYDVQTKFGQIEITSSNGYPVYKGPSDDLAKLEKWIQSRNL